MEQTAFVIFHDADNDGHLSGAIANHFLSQKGVDYLLKGANYGEPFPFDIGEDTDYSDVDLYILDYLYNHAANLVDQIRYHRELSDETKAELFREFDWFIAQKEKKEKRKS